MAHLQVPLGAIYLVHVSLSSNWLFYQDYNYCTIVTAFVVILLILISVKEHYIPPLSEITENLDQVHLALRS